MSALSPAKWISDQELFIKFGYRKAIEAISQALTDGFDPATDKSRSFVEFASGQGLVMPSENAEFVGLKFVTVAPKNPAKNIPRIQGIYTLFDAKTLTPLAQCDGAALTLLRTSCVTVAMVQKLDLPERPKLVVFGSGPQALAHILAISAVSTPDSIRILARNTSGVEKLIVDLRAHGIEAAAGSTKALAEADLVITATTAREPLFALEQVQKTVIVAAVGSHEPNARELPGNLMGIGTVFIEDQSAALREAGDVIMAINEGFVAVEDLVEVKKLFTSEYKIDSQALRIYKSSGMPWQDLAIFGAAYKALI
jgi:ornithine cyclodeaminase/alanine dehydrogenase-like protein (mu-crystallin family)